MDRSEFRRVMGHFATGVTIVAARRRADGAPVALTANAVASVSLEPMLVLTCIEKAADSHDALIESGAFSINILAGDQERLARRFASWDIDRKFDGIVYRTEATGSPILEDVLAWVDCRIAAMHAGGDHTIVVGEVVAGDADEDTPLVYYRGGYGRLVP